MSQNRLKHVSESAKKLADSLVVVAEQIRDCEGLDSGLIEKARELINALDSNNREHNTFCD